MGMTAMMERMTDVKLQATASPDHKGKRKAEDCCCGCPAKLHNERLSLHTGNDCRPQSGTTLSVSQGAGSRAARENTSLGLHDLGAFGKSCMSRSVLAKYNLAAY